MKNININKLIIVFIISSLFIIPMSSLGLLSISNSKIDIFQIERIIFLLLSVYLFFRIRNKGYLFYIVIISMITIIFSKLLVYKELDFSIIYILSSLIYVKYLLTVSIDSKFVDRLMKLSFFTYIFQILIYSWITGEKFISFVTDKNYTGYFLFILFNYFFMKKNYGKAMVLLSLGLFTFSRNFYLVIILFMLFSIKEIKDVFRRILRISLPTYMLIILIIFTFSYIFISLNDFTLPSYSFKQGLDRIIDLNDQSNYIRLSANIFSISQSSVTEFLLGHKDGAYIFYDNFPDKTIYPHNLFFALTYQTGILVTFLFIIYYVKVLSINKDFLRYFVGILCYDMFLGMWSFYGFMIVLQLLIIKSLSNEQSDKKIDNC